MPQPAEVMLQLAGATAPQAEAMPRLVEARSHLGKATHRPAEASRFHKHHNKDTQMLPATFRDLQKPQVMTRSDAHLNEAK